MIDTGYRGKVAIFTSFYSNLAFAPYVESLAATLSVLSKLNIEYQYLCRRSDFHIERALNETLTELMSSDFTDVFLIDSDQSWRAEDFVRLLHLKEDVVAGTYRMKNRWDEYVGSIQRKDGMPQGKMMPDGTALLGAERVAGGFLRIKIDTLRKFSESYPELRSETPPGFDNNIKEITLFFERMKENGTVFCQDMAFSKRLRDIGVELWIDPNLKIGHWGFHNYEGDYDKHLRDKKETDEAFLMVQQMAKEVA